MSSGRQRRTTKDKFAHFREMKEKGERNTYKEDEVDNIFEEVTEEEYSRRVHERLAEDFVVDDGAGTYADDGREIFEDGDGENDRKARRQHGRKETEKTAASKGGIRNFCVTAGAQRSSSQKPVVVDDEEVDELLAALHREVDKTTPSIEEEDVGPVPVNPFVNRDAAKRQHTSPQKTAPPGKALRQSNTPPRPVEIVKVEALSPRQPSIPEQMDHHDDTDILAALAESEVKKVEVKVEMVEKSDKVEADVKHALPEQDAVFSASSQTVEDDRPANAEDAGALDEVIEMRTDEETGRPFTRFYWLDIHEDFRAPGRLYVFGKVRHVKSKAWLSCCLLLRNVERVMYVLPRQFRSQTGEPVTFEDVYDEIKELMRRYKIDAFRCRPVERSYVLDDAAVPRGESQFLELRYNAHHRAIDRDHLEGDTYSHVFGATTPCLETFLLERKLQGPGWLDIQCPTINSPPVTWCNLELTITPDRAGAQQSAYLKPVHNCKIPAPPLRLMVLNITTCHSTKNKSSTDQIVLISVLTNSAYPLDKEAPVREKRFTDHCCLVGHPDDQVLPFDWQNRSRKQEMTKIMTSNRETGLLQILVSKINKFDPDLIVGHDLCGYQSETLLARMFALKLHGWSRIGRLRRSGFAPRVHSWKHVLTDCFTGRLVLDVSVAARELRRCKSYDLANLVEELLPDIKNSVLPFSVDRAFASSPTLLQLVSHRMKDALHSLHIMAELNALPLYMSITSVVGGIMSRTLFGGRSERNEFLLLHAFHDGGFICPDKHFPGQQQHAAKRKAANKAKLNQSMASNAHNQSITSNAHNQSNATHVMEMDVVSDEEDGGAVQATGGRRKPAYSGGLVLEPKKGFYDNFILLLDFNSLYPSIIQEFNICFTTINLSAVAQQPEGFIADVPSSEKFGILPTEIRKLVEARKQVKKLLRQAKERYDREKTAVLREQILQHDIRQMALKLTANSMYGCLGFGGSRFFARPLAALVTSKGREILMQAKDIVERMGEEVIYGDTDSVMVNTRVDVLEEAMAKGRKIKAEVNKLYRQLELDIDGVYRVLLLLKKKKYAGLKMDLSSGTRTVTVREVKGLDLVRRDWAEVAKEAGTHVLDELLKEGNSRENALIAINDYLIEFAKAVREGKVEIDKFLIAKQLTKSPNEYADSKSLPHVQVALRLNSKGGRQFRQGDTIYYLVCKDNTTNSATQRAYHQSEVEEPNSELTLDIDYYLSQQVHPVVSRLCEPIEGMDPARVAQCLGLDVSHYRSSASTATRMDEGDMFLANLDTSSCESFVFTCRNASCRAQNKVDSALCNKDGVVVPCLMKCTNEACDLSPVKSARMLRNILRQQIRSAVNRYHAGWLLCDDSTCGFRSRSVLRSTLCQRCKLGALKEEYSEMTLLSQLSFMKEAFDLTAALDQLAPQEKVSVLKLIASEPQVQACYTELKNECGNWLSKNAFSEINLGILFDSLLPAKRF